ncbi:MAG TPA: ABC transporter substrate-binding protein, partial [Trueperaceae bacterium]|nr:ABC transporter substrate-binding protein [Trueperaceae bacterium]
MKSLRFAVSYRLLVAVGLALCCLLPSAAAQQAGGKLTVAIGVPAVTLAPGKSIASIVNSITEGIYEGLVERDASGAVLPGLATSWSLDADNVTWTLTLRQGVRFHDGTEFSADDVKATFDRILNPAFELPLSSVLKVVSRVEVVDPYTVKIVTGSPTPDFLNRLAYGVAVIISSDAVEKYGADIDWTPVGTGPYRLESYVPNESVTLVAFPDYWGGTPLLDRVEFRTVREPGTRVALLEAGEVDIIVDVPATDLPGLKAQADKAVLLAPSTRVMHIGVNTQVAPFDNVLVRQA